MFASFLVLVAFLTVRTVVCLPLFPQTIVACAVSYGFDFAFNFEIEVVGVMAVG